MNLTDDVRACSFDSSIRFDQRDVCMFHVEHCSALLKEFTMAKAPDDRTKMTQSKLGRGLGSLIPVPIQRTTSAGGAQPVTGTTSEVSGRNTGDTNTAFGGRTSAPSAGAVEPKPAQTVLLADASADQLADGMVTFISVRAIQPGKYQPRGGMDPVALDTLARSIEQSGLMQPVVVRPLNGSPGRFELIAGERRWRAMDQLGRTEIPAIVQAVDDRQAAELSLIENLQREDLNPMDRAAALRRLADDFGLTHQDLAGRVGLDRATVSNLLRLNDLDGGSASHVRSGAISLGHAKVLLGVTEVGVRRNFAEQAAVHGWSVRELEGAVRDVASVPRGTPLTKAKSRGPKSAHLADLRRQLEQHLGTRVDIKVGRKKGAGELRIQFFSLDEFDGLMQRIGFDKNRLPD